MNKIKLSVTVLCILTIAVMMNGCEDTKQKEIADPLPTNNITSSDTRQNIDILNYSIINKEIQKKGSSVNPPQPPKYILLIENVTLEDYVELNKKNVCSFPSVLGGNV